MTSDDNQVDAKLTSDTLASFGSKLKTTREAMGYSIQDASLRLHLSPRFIDLLENEDLLNSKLPPIYLRGYLRSYSKLLNIPNQEIDAVLEKLAPTPAILTATPAPTESTLALSFPLQNNPYFTRMATAFVALILLTSVTTWWYMHNGSNETTTIAANEPLASTTNNEVIQMAANNPVASPTLNTESANTNLAANPAPTPEPATASAPSLPAPAAASINPQLAIASDSKAANNPTASAPQASPKSAAKPIEQEEGDEEQD